MLKTCTKCGEEKAESEYSRSGKRSDGTPRYQTWCKACNRKQQQVRDARRRYGLSYSSSIDIQTSPCALCGRSATSNTYGKSCVDHCHETGRVRGALCSRCNNALGMFRDSPELLRAAAAYLEAGTDYRDA